MYSKFHHSFPTAAFLKICIFIGMFSAIGCHSEEGLEHSSIEPLSIGLSDGGYDYDYDDASLGYDEAGEGNSDTNQRSDELEDPPAGDLFQCTAIVKNSDSETHVEGSLEVDIELMIGGIGVDIEQKRDVRYKKDVGWTLEISALLPKTELLPYKVTTGEVACGATFTCTASAVAGVSFDYERELTLASGLIVDLGLVELGGQFGVSTGDGCASTLSVEAQKVFPIHGEGVNLSEAISQCTDHAKDYGSSLHRAALASLNNLQNHVLRGEMGGGYCADESPCPSSQVCDMAHTNWGSCINAITVEYTEDMFERGAPLASRQCCDDPLGCAEGRSP